MINTIDWISFYLAIMYKVDPSPVNNIIKLKSFINELIQFVSGSPVL